MLRKLKTQFFSTQTEKLLKKANADKTHNFIHLKYIYQLSNFMLSKKQKNELLNFLHQSLNSTNLTLKIKSLTILHACIRISFDEDACQLVMNLEQITSEDKSQKLSNNQKQLNIYINAQIINFYILYLKKICMNRDTFYYLKKYLGNNQKKLNKIEIMNHGFNMLNLCNYLFQSYQMFSKMGRYFIQYQQIISMYIQILQDLDLFNSYLKKSLVENLKQHDKEQIKYSDIQLSKISPYKPKINDKSSNSRITKISHAQRQQNKQQTKHFFVYLRQSQKVLQRMFQFFHIRYYYHIVSQMITFPMFITIKNSHYMRIQNKTKKIDRNLVQLNIKSKYDFNNTFTWTRSKTQGNAAINVNWSLPQINCELSLDEDKYIGSSLKDYEINQFIQDC